MTRMSMLAATIATVFAMAAAPAYALKPFTAQYDASFKGISAGGSMSLSQQGNRWTYAMGIRNAAANLEFEEAARLRDEIKRLRETTTITYLGDFDRAAAKTAEPIDKPAVVLPLAVPVENAGKPAASAEQGAMERGIQGLK